MAIFLLRPNLTISATGWAQTGPDVFEAIADNNLLTAVEQNDESASMLIGLGDLPGDANINYIVSVTPVINAITNGRGNTEVEIELLDEGNNELSGGSVEFDVGVGEEKSPFTYSIPKSVQWESVNAMRLRMIPNNLGVNIREVYLKVIYYEIGNVRMATGEVKITQGKVVI